MAHRRHRIRLRCDACRDPAATAALATALVAPPQYSSELIFPLESCHNQNRRDSLVAAISDARAGRGRPGAIHVTYSYFTPDGKSIKHAPFSEEWVRAGDPVE